MKQLLSVCLITVAFLLPSAYSQSQDDPDRGNLSNFGLLVHRAGNINLAVTNYGVLGSYGGSEYDEEASAPAPSAMYPAESELDYLFSGSLWIGAIVTDSLNPEKADTLVSVGDDCWWYGIHELSSTDDLNRSLYKQQRTADEEIVAVYYDTLTEKIRPNPKDDRPHKPLGLKITQKSMAWSSQGYDEIIVIDYYIENIYDRILSDARVGIYIDNNVGRFNDDSETKRKAFDDLCGYMNFKGKPLVWLADDDGNPDGGYYNENSSDDVLALMYLGSSIDSLEYSYNWWVSSAKKIYDWGPQSYSNYAKWAEYEDSGKGTPTDDIRKFLMMANGEIDYDQAYSALDWRSGGWIANSSENPYDVADGYDGRCLLSFGPFEFEPGKVETLSVAFVAGRALHRDVDNYRSYLKGHTDDSLSIAAYYNNLDFTKLYANLDTALVFSESGWDQIPPGPPSDFKVITWNTNNIILSWQRQKHQQLGGYLIYRGIEPGVYDPVPLTPMGYTDTVFSDYQVEDNTTYYYAISSANIYGQAGDFSTEIEINTGQPQTPKALTCHADKGRAELNWLPTDDDDLYGYVLYQKESGMDEYKVIDTTTFNFYSENNLQNGTKYFYSVRALDIYGNISFYSDSVRAIPMAFDSGIMLINANRGEWIYNPDYDSMTVFYEALLADYHHMIAYECPGDLAQLSPYSTIIWCKDIIPGRFDFESEAGDYKDLFADYLEAGGQFILAGPRISGVVHSSGEHGFNGHDFQYKYLNLAGVNYPNLANTEFVGGLAEDEEMPDFITDAERANRMVYPKENDSGRLFGIGGLMPRDSTEVIYRYIPVEPDTSYYYDMPLAIIHETQIYKTATLEFPLYYVDRMVSSDIMHAILSRFEEQLNLPDPGAPVPEIVELLQNYPNPFNFRTEIRYVLPLETEVKLEIFDILGRSIITLVDEHQGAGTHSVSWDGKSASGSPATSGIYFYRLTTGDDITARRMVYLK